MTEASDDTPTADSTLGGVHSSPGNVRIKTGGSLPPLSASTARAVLSRAVRPEKETKGVPVRGRRMVPADEVFAMSEPNMVRRPIHGERGTGASYGRESCERARLLWTWAT